MTNTVPVDRKNSPELDTAVRSLSTLRKPVLSGRPGDGHQAILVDVQDAVRTAPVAGLRRVASPESNVAFQPRVLLSLKHTPADDDPSGPRRPSFRRCLPPKKGAYSPGG